MRNGSDASAPADAPRRVVVVGTTGSGKTTMARALAGRLGVPHVELDALHWEPNWTEAEVDVFRARVRVALSGDAWVVDGNYGKVRDLVWPRAEVLIWLDYSFMRTFWQLSRRTLVRMATGEELWSGNRERFRSQFLSRDSLFLWFFKTYPRHRHEFPQLVRRPEHRHLRAVRLRSPAAARAWLARIRPLAPTSSAPPAPNP